MIQHLQGIWRAQKLCLYALKQVSLPQGARKCLQPSQEQLPACQQLRTLSQQPRGLFDPLPTKPRLLISSNNRDVCSSEVSSLKMPQTNFS